MCGVGFRIESLAMGNIKEAKVSCSGGFLDLEGYHNTLTEPCDLLS